MQTMALAVQLPGSGFTVTQTDDYGNSVISVTAYIISKFSWKPRGGQPLWYDFSLSMLENI